MAQRLSLNHARQAAHYYTCTEDPAVTGYAGFGPSPEDVTLVRNARTFTLSYTPPPIPEFAAADRLYDDPFVVCPSGNWILDPSYSGSI